MFNRSKRVKTIRCNSSSCPCLLSSLDPTKKGSPIDICSEQYTVIVDWIHYCF